MIRLRQNKNFIYQWVMLAIGAFLIAGAVIHNVYKNYIDTVKRERERLLAQTYVIRENLGNRLDGTNHILNGIRDELAVLPPSKWGTSAFNQYVKLVDQTASGIRTISVYDATGTIVLTNRKELLGFNFKDSEYFKTAQQNQDPGILFVSPPFKTVLGVWAMNLVKVIPGSGNTFAGIVVATLDPLYFRTLLGSINYAADMWGSIVHENGLQFLMVPEKEGQPGKNLNRSGTLFSRHLSSRNDTSIFIDTVYATGDKRMLVITTLRPESLGMNKALVVAVSRNLGAITGEWLAQAIRQGVTLVFIILASAITLATFQQHQQAHFQQMERADADLRDTRQQLQEIIDFLPDATFVLDEQKRVVIWNRAIEEMTGISKSQMIGKGENECTIPFYGERRKHLPDLLDLNDGELAEKYAGIKRHGETIGAEAFCPALYSGKGAYVWAMAQPLYNSSGKRIGVVESIRDMSEQKAAQAAMQQNQEYLRKLYHGIEHSASAVLITDINGTIEYINRKFCQMTGYSAEEAIGKNPRILKSESTPREVFSNLWNTILSGIEWHGELQNRRKNGEIYWSLTSISPLHNEKGVITHFIANVEDINERKNAEATIEHLAYYDALTDLPNRRMLKERLDLAMKRSRRQNSKMALLYLDIDSFKRINDSMGHPAGDALLREMAGRYREYLREDDVLCRLGGDEFAVIVHDIHRDEDAALVAEKLLELTARPVTLDGMDITVTVSIGVALFPQDGEEGDSLEKNSDIALYRAKEEGKNAFRFFSKELNSITRERVALEHALRYALEKNELILLYQPKVNIQTGKVTGVEALLRWNSPVFGMVSPIRFIPIAEETRAIISIGEWVLHSGCRQQVLWRNQGLDLDMAVNLSAVQFKSPALISLVSAVLDETGICPGKLELELTESALVEKPEAVVRVLEQLRSLGCSIAIDDFGTGYSSLSYLKTFPVNILKIDRSFVRYLSDDSGDRAIAQSVVALARNLKMTTVGEGVETVEQQRILKELGCNYVQGFLYSQPVRAEDIAQAVKHIESALSES